MFYQILIFFLGITFLYGDSATSSAGIVERELEKEYEQQPLDLQRDTPPIQIDIPEEHFDMPEGKEIYIRQIEIEGNESISTKQILSHIKSYTKKSLTLKKIYELCHRIDQLYAEKGYFLARCYAPPQMIENGILKLKMVEGKLGNITVIGERYYKASFIKAYFTSLANKPLHRQTFMKSLMLLNDNQDLFVTAAFEKGKEYGYADVILKVKDQYPLHLYVNGNNYGKDLTTNTRAGGRIDWGNLFFQGDRISIAEVMGFPVNALYFTDVNYSTFLNKKGTSLKLSYLFSRSKVEEMTYLDLRGRSMIGSMQVNQALVRGLHANIDVYSSFAYKQIKNLILDYTSSYDKLRVFSLGSIIDLKIPGKARNFLNLALAAGAPDFLGGLSSIDSSCSRVGGGGKFWQANVDYDHIMHLPKGYSFHLHASGQYSPNYLTTPQQIYIGGNDTVRGYPLAAALGDSGYYINLDMLIPPPFFGDWHFFRSKKTFRDIFQFNVFYDHGGTFLQSIQNTFLNGAGIGCRISGLLGLKLSIDVGFALNHRDLTQSAFTYIKLTGSLF